MQITTHYQSGQVTKFIEKSTIKDLLLVEGIQFFQIRLYLAIMTADELIVAFPNILPPDVHLVWKKSRQMLFNGKEA